MSNMNHYSPKYFNNGNRNFRYSDEFKSSFTSSPNHSVHGFSPYSYSSPKNRNRGGFSRYFNNSPGSSNSSGSNASPYPYNRNKRDSYQRNGRGSFDSASINISLYYDPTAMEDPWAELEKELEEKRKKENYVPITGDIDQHN